MNINLQTLLIASLCAATVAALFEVVALTGIEVLQYGESNFSEFFFNVFIISWLFVAIGFLVPACIFYFFASIGAHGEPSQLESEPEKAFITIAVQGLVGGLSAFSAWLVLRFSNNIEPTAGLEVQ